jgi:hypothetical protein
MPVGEERRVSSGAKRRRRKWKVNGGGLGEGEPVEGVVRCIKPTLSQTDDEATTKEGL